jgi:predicted membrane protein
MRNQGLIFIGILLIGAGLTFLLGNLFDINLAAFCFPIGLILLGAFLILRPRMLGPDTRTDVLFLGDWERTGVWSVGDEELWSFIGDINYDLTKAVVPKGESLIRLNGFINDVEIFVPGTVGVAVEATSFITSFTPPDSSEEDYFLSPARWESSNYQSAERRVRFQLSQFIGDITVRQF